MKLLKSKLGDVTELRAGIGFPERLQGRISGDYPFAKVGDISRVGRSGHSLLSAADHYISENDLVELRAKPIPVGSVVFAKIGEAIRHNHRAVTTRQLLVDNNAMAAIPSDQITTRYLYHFLRTVDFYRLASSTTVPALRKSVLSEIEIPLPPLAEQKRIAGILDAADALRAKRREALAQLQLYRVSLFSSIFGKPLADDRWAIAKVGNVGDVQLGRQRAPKYQTGKHTKPYVRVANVYEDEIDTSDVLSMDFDDRDFATYRLQNEDILLNEGQSTELVGRPAMWNGEIPDCCFQNTLVRFRADRTKVTPAFALEVFLYYLRFGEFAKVSTKTSNVAHLGAARFARMPLPVPPIELQMTFSRSVNALKAQQARMRAHLAELDLLFASLQSRAFRGEL
ncbi:MAG: restriction endonuclease subunit S [Tepidisphaeraceae bacterium]